MLTEERITSYISTLTKKGGKPAGEDLKRKTRKALERMLVILLESGHDEPDESDYAKYSAYSKYDEEGTAQDIKRIERYFEPKEERSKQLSMIPEEEMTEGMKEPETMNTGVDDGASTENVQASEAEMTAPNEPESLPETDPVNERPKPAKNKGGRKPIDTNGEKKSEKFMMYFTPSLMADIRDWCSLKRVSCVDYITGLINADLEKKKERLEFFRKFSDES